MDEQPPHHPLSDIRAPLSTACGECVRSFVCVVGSFLFSGAHKTLRRTCKCRVIKTTHDTNRILKLNLDFKVMAIDYKQ